ncbi:MAG: SulP family inorganic anion transporter [Actinobacteria bacterium]|jgi:high affinity sulfate transporter 1|nr:SulP family inorganic anion transporter [Micrococcales bacterium]MCB0905125.1 SulP family inorganic anion transporter [Actinomycetota bacterium]MCO5299469.1 SulP family inorganic anion transporter [Candidatus Nanopelagicales bacterium]MCB9427881.1 SulP family inorganic anion transporter [Actinomycetota bacterium]HPQ85827.1 SulP family inorganic anion transporter [Actinomycetota bacterium]
MRLPVVGWIKTYPIRYLGPDLLAGLVVAALAMPQSLGYAAIAGVPVLVGLYSIPLALIAYALFGSSPRLVVGPVSTVSVLSGSLVADLSGGDPDRAVAMTSALALSAGVGLIIGGLLKLGWAAEFMSRPIVTGFVFGLVLLIILGEIPSLLGMPPEQGDVIARAWSIFTSLGEITPLTALVGLGALTVLFVGAKLAPRVPWGLVVLIVAIVGSGAWNLSERGVATVGEVPTGFPPFGLPGVGLADLGPIVTGGLALGLVGLAEGLSAARLLAARGNYTVDTDQELIATGAANLGSGLSGGMGVAGSLSKTAAAERAGSRTQITGVGTALIVMVAIVSLAGALSNLPKAVLSAIVIQAVWGLMDVAALRRYRQIRRNDFTSSTAALIGVLLFGPLYGLLAAIGLAVLGLVYRSSRIDLEIMGKVPDEKAAWGSIRDHPERRTYDGILVIRLDSPLFWANATQIADGVLAEVEQQDDVQAVLLDLEATSQLDTTSVDALERIRDRLATKGVELYLVRVFYMARQVLNRSGFVESLGEGRMWHSISAGVRAARKDLGINVKARPQLPDDDDMDERIAAERESPGGYSDINEDNRRWWQ